MSNKDKIRIVFAISLSLIVTLMIGLSSSTGKTGTSINQIINEKGEICFDDERFKDVTLRIYTSINNFPYIIETHINNKVFRFSYQNNSYIYINNII